MANAYKIDEPCAISFSGGRSSGFMLKKIIDAHNGLLPEYCKVLFANTGKEMPQTLDFVNECANQWDISIIWLECDAVRNPEGSSKKYTYYTKQVNYETASRNGEPFEKLIKARNYLPNPVARYCTQDLKILRIRDYMNNFYDDWVNVVGLRADEQRRVSKMATRKDVILPMAEAGHTVKDVKRFWDNLGFDLNLPNNNGKTEWGNCDLCFLKGLSTKKSIAREKPELCDWWINQEKYLNDTFRRDQPSYTQIKLESINQVSIFEDMQDCFCTD